MFYNCTSLVTVDTTNNGQNGMAEIGYGAFGACTALTNLTLPFVGRTYYGNIEEGHEIEGLLGYIFGHTEFTGTTLVKQRYDSETEEVTFDAPVYVNGEYLDLIPPKPVIGKLLLMVEEFSRFHYNVWPNFPWLDYIYKDEVEKDKYFFTKN